MKRIIIYLLTSILLLLVPNALAQGQEVHRFKQKTRLVEFDNYRYDILSLDSTRVRVRNLYSSILARTGQEIIDVQFSPDGLCYAVLLKNGSQQEVRLFDFAASYSKNKYMATLKANAFVPTALCFASDGKTILVADNHGSLHRYNLSTRKLKRGNRSDHKRSLKQSDEIGLGIVASQLAVSSDGKYIVASSGNEAAVFSLNDRIQVKSIAPDARIVAVEFPADDSYLAILLSDGSMSLYDTQNFMLKSEVTALGLARQMAIHPNSKYVAVVTADNGIAVVNTKDIEDRQYVFDDEGGITDVCFVADNNTWLGYNTLGCMVFHEMADLNPNFRQLMDDELAERMEEWMQRMPNETLEEYNLRVSEDNRARQIKLFEEEIATRLAEDRLFGEEFTLGGYNYNEGILSIDLGTMPSIYLNVPENELRYFASVDQLEFRNARYALTEADCFELVYVDVFNKKTGVTYTYSNRERKSLEYLKLDDSYVPLDLIQLSNMQELVLEDIKNNVVSDAQSKNVKLEHTNISVTTQVMPDTDADGNRIMNYRVGFSYDVDKQFSSVEDFAAGEFRVTDSSAASSMVNIIAQAFKGEFAKYVKEGKRVVIAVTGMADNLKINHTLPYDGSYGEFVNEPVFEAEGLRHITVTSQTGIAQNEQLAFIRATGVKDYIVRNIPELKGMDTDYEYHIELADAAGGAFRRITVTFTFIDAF